MPEKQEVYDIRQSNFWTYKIEGNQFQDIFFLCIYIHSTDLVFVFFKAEAISSQLQYRFEYVVWK